MEYTFELVGILPTLYFFNHQQKVKQHHTRKGAEYVGTYQCTLDALIASVETVTPDRKWNLDRVIDSVINFWLNNGEKVRHWKRRLNDAGSENLLIARVADVSSLRDEFELLFNRDRPII